MEQPIVQIVIPSHKRATNLLTPKAIANTITCVPMSQLADYMKHNPGVEFVGHPDTVIGISQKRQWIYEKYKNVFMADDDILAVKRNYLAKGVDSLGDTLDAKLDPLEAYEAVQHLADMARQFGCKLFGFTNSGNPKFYQPQSPFSFNKMIVGASLGMLESDKLHFPMEQEAGTVEDQYINLINAFYHRFSLIDNRFSMDYFPVEKNTGGMGTQRTVDREKDGYFYLKQKFGKAVTRKKSGSSVHGHEWESVLNLPY